MRGGKGTQTQTFWSGYLRVGWGGLPREGVGAEKSSACRSKPGKREMFGGTSRDFAGISRRRPKSLRKKSLCSISVPYLWMRAWSVTDLKLQRKGIGFLSVSGKNFGRLPRMFVTSFGYGLEFVQENGSFRRVDGAIKQLMWGKAGVSSNWYVTRALLFNLDPQKKVYGPHFLGKKAKWKRGSQTGHFRPQKV